MIKASASHKKEASVRRLLRIRSKSLAIVAVSDSSFYHHRLDVVPDSGDVRHCDASNPIANQQAETTPRPLLITEARHNQTDENGC